MSSQHQSRVSFSAGGQTAIREPVPKLRHKNTHFHTVQLSPLKRLHNGADSCRLPCLSLYDGHSTDHGPQEKNTESQTQAKNVPQKTTTTMKRRSRASQTTIIIVVLIVAVFLLCCNNIRLGVDIQQQYHHLHHHDPDDPVEKGTQHKNTGGNPKLENGRSSFVVQSSVTTKASSPQEGVKTFMSNRGTTLLAKNSIPSNTTIRTDEQEKKNLTHFVFHIPKTGATYAHATIVEMITNHPKWQKLSESQKFQPCNQAKEPLENFEERYNYASKFNLIRCSSWMSEVPYSDLPGTSKYTILREPTHHVVSQYFHCKESPSHAYYKERMPSRLIIWLNMWKSIFDKERLGQDPLRLKPKSAAYNRTANQLFCYNPINMQSYMTQFNALTHDSDELASRYNIIGNTQQMTQTICAIVIDMTDGWIIPTECNCTSNVDEVVVAPLQQQRRKLVQEYNVSVDNHAHGVQHHGATYEASSGELRLINEYTKYDQALYKMSMSVFAEQLVQLENKYNIKICERFTN